MKYPQDKFAGSLGAREFQARVDYIRVRGFPSLSTNEARRARLVLVDGFTVRELAEHEGVSRFTLYKPIRAVSRAVAPES